MSGVEYLALDRDGLHATRAVGEAFVLGCLVQTPTRERMLAELDAFAPAHDVIDRVADALEELERKRLGSDRCHRCGDVFDRLEGDVVPILRCRGCGRELPAGTIG